MACSAAFCDSRTTIEGVKNPEISFHVFPKCPEMREKWIKALRRKNWEPTKFSRVCSKHFEKSSFISGLSVKRLKSDAVPVIIEGCTKYYQPTMAKKRKYLTKYNINVDLSPRKRRQFEATGFSTEDLPTTSRLAMKAPMPETLQTEEKYEKKPNLTSQPQQKIYNPFNEYANDSNDEELSEIKEEANDSYDDEQIDDATPNTEKVFVKCISGKGKQPKRGQSRAKRSPLDTTEDPDDYEEEFYEFGKYVAEQLLCLDVEDARIARMDIVGVLSMFAHKRIREPSTSETSVPSTSYTTKYQIVNPVVSSVTSTLQDNTESESKYVNDNAGSSVNQTVQTNVLGSSVGQISQVKITGLPVSRRFQYKLSGPSRRQNSKVNSMPSMVRIPQLNTGTIPRTVVKIRPISAKYAMIKMKPGSLSEAPLGYVVVPATGSGLNIAQHGNTGGTSVIQPGSSTSVRDTVSQPSPVMAPDGSLVSQTGSSNMDSEITVKTELKIESTHVNVFASEKYLSPVVKSETEIGDET